MCSPVCNRGGVTQCMCYRAKPWAARQGHEAGGVFLAAASRGWAGWTPPPPPPPPLPPRGWPRLAKNGWGGNLAKIKENEEKTATLGVPRGASQPLLTCGYMCYCIWGY